MTGGRESNELTHSSRQAGMRSRGQGHELRDNLRSWRSCARAEKVESQPC